MKPSQYYYILYSDAIKSLLKLSRLLEALLSGLPVDDVPDGVEVLGLAVLVLEASKIVSGRGRIDGGAFDLLVGVLPGINTKDRSELANDSVLVSVGLDLNSTSLSVLDQPSPARTLNAGQSSVELLLHGVEAAEVRVDGLGESARWRLTAALRLGREVLPEESVVDVTACAEEMVRQMRSCVK